jgi:hypothetical protein
LANAKQTDAATVRRRYRRWLARLKQAGEQRTLSSALHTAVQHFLKVTSSYGDDLFHCYRIDGLPRTNNDLEHVFGSVRYHERRASGRKVGSAAIVLYGAVRLPAAVFMRTEPVTITMLTAVPHERWRAQRTELERRRQSRCQRYRFRKNPRAYLAHLEEAVCKLTLPS